ncbi:MAG TPA: sigma-70 family RNA polymerase sigma factor [Mycobacteriales bacterium]|nr:sigma-70 family RNA polymerase sigma factor [Mycobacteriales bacterium]
MSVPLPRPAEHDETSDGDLISAVRSGDSDAYGVLYRRHAGSALGLARQLTGSRAEADDLVAESFAKVLDVLRAGGGPDAAFRAYLLTTLRHTLYDRARRDRKLELSDDMTRHDRGVPFQDTAVAGLESSLAARAFNRLPERWQTVLWHTEVEQESPAQVAPLLGLTPNGVAALAYRAREGLRQAYLQEHLADGVDGAHRATVTRLGAWARGGLSDRQRTKVDAHLAVCEQCSALADELVDVNGGLRSVIAPLVLGTGAAAYLAHVTGGGAGVAAAAAGTAAAAGGAAAGGTAGTAAAAGGAAAGGTAGAAVAGEAAATGTAGSAFGSVTAWVAGTHAGQAVAAAAAAVVIGGTTVVATHGGVTGPSTGSAAAATSSASGLPGPDERGVAATSGAAAPTPGGTPTGSPTPGPTATGTPTGTPGASGAPTGSPSGPPIQSGRVSAPVTPTALPPAPPVGRPLLDAGSAVPVGVLRRGAPADIGIVVRNTGDDAGQVTATVRLPSGFAVRAGSGGNGWDCAGAGTVATCTRDELDGGDTTTLQVRAVVAADAPLAGMLTGTVKTAGAGTAPITPTRLVVLV